jgi:ABC-2 type transport system permease protein
MRLRPGSFVWLAAQDLRQTWRSFDAAIGGVTRAKAAVLIGAIVALHALFWWAARWRGRVADDAQLAPYIALGVLFVLPGILAQSTTAATRALYTRADLDLLLASPVSARAVLGAKAIAIAVNAIAWFAILLWPLANINVLAGHLRWLAIYPALIDCGLFGAGVGIVLALALFAGVGPRRARVVSQIVATAVGASFMLALQGYATTSGPTRSSLIRAMQSSVEPGWLDARAWVSLPARAAAGSLEALIVWTIVAVAIFAAAIFVLGRYFATAAVLSVGAASAPRRGRKEREFRANLGGALRAKERRLILRDPWLISQILLQVVYMAPISLILWRNGGATGSPGVVFTPLIVVVGAQLAGSLAWLALSGEDAPDLLRAAPVSARRIERHKLEAILAPVALVLAAPIVALTIVSPWSGLWAGIFTIAASVSAALLNLWRQAPARRSRVLQRHAQSKIVGMIEHLLSIVWTVGAVMAVMGSWGAVAPVALACFILWLGRSRAPPQASSSASMRPVLPVS